MANPQLALTAFLSHKYKAPAVNDYFFQLFSESAKVEFEVDLGATSTNVTRLERLIRDADAFIGVYPFDEIGWANPSRADLAKAARYFRLELDIAARARKPGLVFTDHRFRSVISAPGPIKQVPFDIQEVTGKGSKPNSVKFVKAFTEFCGQVVAARKYSLSDNSPPETGHRVGILLPPASGWAGYNRDHINTIATIIDAARFEPVEFQWPPVITPEWIGKIRSLDWAIVDLGELSAATGVVGFLHGEFKPLMRLMRVQEPSSGAADPNVNLHLYSGFEVGYPKDILRWWDSESLLDGMSGRMQSLEAPRRRVSTLDDALKYFRSAALRKEVVFVSYAGADQREASEILEAFRRRFQEVFDYRDGKSIRPGQPWIAEIFNQLAVSPVGVMLLSPAYVESGNCTHELREIVARRDNKQMQIFPVKLRQNDKFLVPTELGDTQYARRWEYGTANELVGWISDNIPA